MIYNEDPLDAYGSWRTLDWEDEFADELYDGARYDYTPYDYGCFEDDEAWW